MREIRRVYARQGIHRFRLCYARQWFAQCTDSVCGIGTVAPFTNPYCRTALREPERRRWPISKWRRVQRAMTRPPRATRSKRGCLFVQFSKLIRCAVARTYVHLMTFNEGRQLEIGHLRLALTSGDNGLY